MGKKILIETESFKSLTSEIENSIDNISMAEGRKNVTGKMPALYKIMGLYERLGIAIRIFKEVSNENIRNSESAVKEINRIDSQLLK